MTPSLRRRLAAAPRTAFALGLALATLLTPLASAGRAGRAALAAAAGTADVALVPPADTVLARAGTTFIVDIQIEPNGVSPDVAVAWMSFAGAVQDVEATGISVVTTDSESANCADPATTYCEIANAIDNTAGTAYVAVGRLNAAWPASPFTLARVTFRLKRDLPTQQSLSLTLQPATAGDPNKTDVAANGVSVLGQVRSATVIVAPATPTPTPTYTQTPTHTPTPTATRTPLPQSPTRTNTPVPTAPPSRTPAPAPPAAPPAGGTTGGSTGGGTGSAGGTSGGSTGNTGGANGSTAAVATATTVSAAQPTSTPRPGTQGNGGVPLGQLGRPVVGDLPPGSVPPLPSAVLIAVNPVAEPFEQYYAERQGLRVLGNTLMAPLREQGRVVQYFEKGRMEDHDDEPNPAWRFQYGLLVDELAQAKVGLPVGGDASTLTYAAIYLLAQADMRAAPPPGFAGGTQTLPDGSVFIPFSAALLPGTGQVVPAGFWAYMNDEGLFPGGWLHDVGLPLTPPVEAVVDKGPDKGRRILVQAFQRTVLTYDPGNPADYVIERANVGTDYARAFPEKFTT